MGGRGGGVSNANAGVPASSRKVVQSLKEIVNCSELEIYAMLVECDMDPDEAVNRLISQAEDVSASVATGFQQLTIDNEEEQEALSKEDKPAVITCRKLLFDVVWSSADYRFENSEQLNPQMQNFDTFPNVLQQGYTSLLPNSLLPSGIQDARESDLHYSPFPTKYNTAAPSSLSSPAIFMAEALRAANISTQNAMPIVGQQLAALTQHLALNPYSHQPGMPLGHYGNLISYPFMAQSYNPYMPSAFQQAFPTGNHQSLAATLPQYKTPVPPPSAYGFGGGAASSNNFPLNLTSTANSYEDVLSSQFKDSNHLASSLQQQEFPTVRRRTDEDTMRRKEWIDNFLQQYNLRKDERKAIHATYPCSGVDRRIARGKIFMLWDVEEEEPEENVFAQNRKKEAGPVRNQSDHDICWIYTGTDLCSSWRLITKEDDEFVTLSAKYIIFYASAEMRQEQEREGDRSFTHHCHGYPIEAAIQFVRDFGVPEEDPNDAVQGFSCVEPPEWNYPCLLSIPDDVEWFKSDKLQDLYRLLLRQPVGANVHFFSPEFDNVGSEIYVGPISDATVYMGLHSVIVTRIRRIGEQLVAVVKSSHGRDKGMKGYMYVSLTRMIVQAGVKGSKHIEGLRRVKEIASPSFLLQDFTVPELPETPKSGSRKKKMKAKMCK